ncbi:MAG: hypothetical protein GEU83_00610 [Pseudonocardiaceae bacterium]|nr:hypothetical protein [Pseudonocardiaceae bacterium]
MTRRYGLPSGRAAWVRVTAAVLAAALVASMGYSALALLSAPGWTVALLLIGVIGMLIGLLSSGADQPGR